MKLKTISQIKSFKNKIVLLRTDFNCPLKKGKVVDDTRIKKVLPTIKYLLKQQARVILISHLGRPLKNQKSKIKNQNNRLDKKEYSLRPVVRVLKKEFSNFKFISTSILDKEIKSEIDKIKPGQVGLLENIRFYPREEKNCLRWAKKIAELGDIYINEAFAVCHRAHSSVVGITHYLPSVAGFLLTQEINALNQVLEKPQHPLIVIMGGKKIITKIDLIKNLLTRADQVLVGGALASNFFKAAGYKIGQSFYEPEMIKKVVPLILKKNLVLPFDLIVKRGRQVLKVNVGELNQLKNDFKISDIGPATIKEFEKYLKNVKIIIWNGPLGHFEDARFSQGTKKISQAILKNKKAKIIIGGGETVMALNQLTNYSSNKKTNLFISSGGGAMLDFLAGKKLPGIEPLLKKK
jgi:phosphoglycerate kinase